MEKKGGSYSKVKANRIICWKHLRVLMLSKDRAGAGAAAMELCSAVPSPALSTWAETRAPAPASLAIDEGIVLAWRNPAPGSAAPLQVLRNSPAAEGCGVRALSAGSAGAGLSGVEGKVWLRKKVGHRFSFSSSFPSLF